MGKSKKKTKKGKKWGPGHPLYDWQHSGKKTKKSKKSKSKGGFPSWLGKYHQLKKAHPGWSKKKLYKEAGHPDYQ